MSLHIKRNDINCFNKQGCITDCDCPNGEECSDNWVCVPKVCDNPHSLTFGNQQLTREQDQQNPGQTVNSTATLTCSKGYVMNILGEHFASITVS